MEKDMKIELIDEIKKLSQGHPSTKHDQDHADLWKAIKLTADAGKDIEEKLHDLDTTDSNIYESLAHFKKRMDAIEEFMSATYDKYKELMKEMANITARHPKIISMKKTALMIDGENVIDTVDLESGRYLMMKYIIPKDSNEYAKLDDNFDWEVVEVTDGKYDVKVQLDTNTEGETATMTANIALLFIKY